MPKIDGPYFDHEMVSGVDNGLKGVKNGEGRAQP